MEKTEEAKAGGNAPDRPTSVRSLLARETVEPSQEEKHMTKESSFGASSHRGSDWKAIDWPKARQEVKRLQLRMAKAIRNIT
jgi:hypothetical protein